MMKRNPTCKKKFHKALDGVLRKGYESPFQRIRHLLWSLGSYLKVSLSISSSRFGNPIYRPEIDSNEVSSSQRKVKNVKKAFAKIFPIKYAQVVVLLQKFSSDIFSEGICHKTPAARIQQSPRAGGSPHVRTHTTFKGSNKPFLSSVVIGVVVASNP